MPVTVRIGAVHLGWDVVSVAAGGGGKPIRPVQVEGMWNPPAYLLADSSGRLHTAGVERRRPDLGMAIADVRDILGHPQIVIAGATWPAELVFRARMYNPLAAIGEFLRGKPDLVALPYPDGWPDEKIDVYVELVEQLDVTAEPLPESVALSGYVRALGLVHPPDRARPHGVGATGVYSDGRTMLVVAVHGDDEQPTESVDVPVTPEAMRDARSADNVVIEVMAAARSIGADTSTVLLTGNVCFNEPLRFAFQNHLGHRLQVADHPIHALVLGASHLLVTDSEYEEPQSGGYPDPATAAQQYQAQQYQAQQAQTQQIRAQQGQGHGQTGQPGQPQQGQAQRPPAPPQRPAEQQPPQRPAEPSRPPVSPQRPPEQQRPQEQRPGAPLPPPSGVQYGAGYPSAEAPTTRIGPDDGPRGVTANPNLPDGRFGRPGEPQPGRPHEPSRPPAGPPTGGPRSAEPPPGPPPTHGAHQLRDQWDDDFDDNEPEGKPRKGKLWGKVKDNLFGS
ncbi:hypothetical protein [Nocardia callitridis]|uniref:Uncharacterized protein n=1 Tax=Nocardia callitridis TaxID=648753 RepID=A0ABP9KZI4_9NOCA